MQLLPKIVLAILSAALLALITISAGGAYASAQTQGKAKDKAKAKSAQNDNTVSSSMLGSGNWVCLVKDLPSGDQFILAYHPQLTQGLPAPSSNPPALTGNTAKAKAALIKQRTEQMKKLKSDWKMVRFDLPETVPMRFFVLPEAFDDKGEILKPTQEQLDQIKKGGIAGKASQLRPGMVVRVSQVQDGARMVVDKVDVLREVSLNLPGLNEKSKTPQPAPSKGKS